MRSIAVHNLKGGVGKTTNAGNIAKALKLYGKKVCMVDCDAQGNLSKWYLGNRQCKELCDVLRGDVKLPEAIIEVEENLYILPTISSKIVNYSESLLVDEPLVFQDLNEVFQTLGFEYVIYDLSPSMRKLEKSVLLAQDEVILPIQAEMFAVDGVKMFSEELEKIKKSFRVSTKFDKIIVNMINHSFRRHNMLLGTIKESPFSIFEIAQDAKIAEAQIKNMSIFDYDSESKTVGQFMEIAKAVI